jgi:hypothetical protein
MEESDIEHPGPMTLTLNLVTPAEVTLGLTKTTLPIYQFGRSGARTRMETHTFIVITTIPRTPMMVKEAVSTDTSPTSSIILDTPEIIAGRANPVHRAVEELRQSGMAVDDRPHAHDPRSAPRTTILPSPSSPPRTVAPPLPIGATVDPHVAQAQNQNLTPTDEIMALDMCAGEMGAGRPLFFNRDGTVSRPRGTMSNGRAANGKPLDVHELLRTFDWGKTSLGPRESWPQSLRTIGVSLPDKIHGSSLTLAQSR